ncbi:MAG TPA: TIGR03435 family protein [Bryobacteraceae bacterium]|jgi:uncharacterized protein (TIGR03435 family)
MRTLSTVVFALISGAAFGQAPTPAEAPPTFEIADVHVSPHTLTPNMRGGYVRAGRYEILTATMLDLIRTAYSVDPDKVLGGPSWLDSDRFDVIAKAPANTSPDAAKLMLQALLADRFKLVVHNDSHALPGFALTIGKSGPPKLKEADGSGDTGCKYTIPPPPPPPPAGAQAGPGTINLPTYFYECHNMTMAAFADAMRTMLAAQQYFDTGLIADQTGLKGAYDFNFKYGPKITGGLIALLVAPGAESISIFDAMDKQLGLKLDPLKVETPVVIVDSVNRKPTDNPPGVSTALPLIPAEFDVADLRLSDPSAARVPSPGFQPSGRVDLRNYPLTAMINLALNANGPDSIVGLPKSLATINVDLIAKMPGNGPATPNQGIDIDFFRPALKALLEDRFKLKTHIEQRPGDAYTLLAPGKPKLQKTADPLVRTGCKEGPGPDGKDPRVANPILSRLITCQNITMAQFADMLPRLAGGYVRSEVLDATGLDGAYDFTLSFSANGIAQFVAQVQSGGAAAGGSAAASDPGGGLSLSDAVSKQLGLKLEIQKRPLPVVVVDHIEEKPSDN